MASSPCCAPFSLKSPNSRSTTITQIPNIGPKGQWRRMTSGAVALGIAVAAAIVLIVVGAPKPWRLGLFLPIWLGMLGVFQARDKT